MKLTQVIVGVLAVILLVLLLGFLGVLFTAPPEETPTVQASMFRTAQYGMAGETGYVVFSWRGKGNLTIVAHDSDPQRTVYVLNDSRSVDASRLPELVSQLMALEKYGFKLIVTNSTDIEDGIIVLPTGAMPSYALFNLQQNLSNDTFIYLGKKDQLLASGIKKTNWYSQLSDAQRKRLVVYEGTVNELLQSGNLSLDSDILRNAWSESSSRTIRLDSEGTKTATISLDNSTRIRLIYALGDSYGIFDTDKLVRPAQILTPVPASIFPPDQAKLDILLNKTNGTAMLSVSLNGKEVQREQLGRVTDQNLFPKKLQYPDPGDYLITVSDNSGPIATGLLHVKDLRIVPVQKQGLSYIFSVTLDGEPLENGEAEVWIGNSSTRNRFFIDNGTLAVGAQLDKGVYTFNVKMFGNTLPVRVENTADPLLNFYLNYGLPGIALVLLVYFSARMSRRPTYTLRFGDSATYVREEVRIPLQEALETFKKAREDMKLGKSPITPHEFSVALKRWVTEGAEITEGNVEGILKQLVSKKYMESHREYYQLRGEGDVKKNVLRRIIRENLIQNGLEFKESGAKFIIKDCEIGFFGDSFSKKAIIVVDDETELRRIMAGLSRGERAKVEILKSNGMISFVPIDQLGGAL